MIMRETVRDKLMAYLNRHLTLAELVDWAEKALLDDEIDEREAAILRDIVGRIGVADVREFGLTWEDCYDFLARLGYIVEVRAVPA
jgi:hypothetical protein